MEVINLLKPSCSTLRTTRFNINKLYMLLTLHLCVLYSSQEKRRLLLYTLTDWLCVTKVESVYCAVRTESLHIKQTNLVFKG